MVYAVTARCRQQGAIGVFEPKCFDVSAETFEDVRASAIQIANAKGFEIYCVTHIVEKPQPMEF